MGGGSSHHHYHTDPESERRATEAAAAAAAAQAQAEETRRQLEQQRQANERMFEQQRQAQEQAAEEQRKAQMEYQRRIEEAQRLRQAEAEAAARRMEEQRQAAAQAEERARQEQAMAAQRLEAEKERRAADAAAAARRLEEEREAADERVAQELQNERERVHAEKHQKWLALNREYPIPEYLKPFVSGVGGTAAEDAKQDRFVNIALLGNSGTGKSSLIRRILEHFNTKTEAKDLPVPLCSFEGDGTLEPAPYKLDNFGDKVRLWDLPGQGTHKFPAKTYLRNMGLKYFDAVLPVCDGRWTETDGHLLEAIRFANIWTNVVRTKVDQAVEEGIEDHGLSQEEILQKVRATLAEQLPEPDPKKIHLVTSRKKYWIGQHGGLKFGTIDGLCEQVAARVESHVAWLGA